MLVSTHSAVIVTPEDGAQPAVMPCRVEVHIGTGLPGFDVVGWPSVRETRDRIRAAILNQGFAWPMQRITVSVPLDVLHPGVRNRATLDLAIATGILAASGQIEHDRHAVFAGELGLDGSVREPEGPIEMADALFTDDLDVVQWGSKRIDHRATLGEAVASC